jgi:hypothetical protein
MPDIGSDVAFRISQTGAEQVKADIEGVVGATDKAGKSSGRFAQFIKEERAEHRQRSFALREGTQVLTTMAFATIALGSANSNASKETQQLTKSLLSGIMSSQAADFAIKGLGLATGGTATAISTVIGLGVALLTFLSDSKEHAIALAAAFMDTNRELDRFALRQTAADKKVGLRSDMDLQKDFFESMRGQSAKEAEIDRLKLKGMELSGDAKTENDNAIATLERQLALEKSHLSIISDEWNIRGSIIGGQERKIQVLQEELRLAKNINDIHRLNLDISREEEKLRVAKTGGWENFAGKEDTTWDIWDARFEGRQARSRGQSLATQMAMQNRLRKSFGKDLTVEQELEKAKEIQEAQRKANQEQMRFLGLLDQGVGILGQAVSFLGIKADSLVSKLLDAMNMALSVMKIIQGLGMLSSAVSGIGSIAAAGGFMEGGGLGIGILPFSKQPGSEQPIIIQAMDGGSVANFVRKNRREFVGAVRNAVEMGY